MEEKLTIPEILTAIVGELKMSKRSFALGMDIAYSRVNDLFIGRTKNMPKDIKDAIINTYHIRPDYLLTGRGLMRMFVEPDSSSDNSDDPVINSFLNCIGELNKRKKTLEVENVLLRKEIEELKQQLSAQPQIEVKNRKITE